MWDDEPGPVESRPQRSLQIQGGRRLSAKQRLGVRVNNAADENLNQNSGQSRPLAGGRKQQLVGKDVRLKLFFLCSTNSSVAFLSWKVYLTK